jgi:hypothetical protein
MFQDSLSTDAPSLKSSVEDRSAVTGCGIGAALRLLAKSVPQPLGWTFSTRAAKKIC